MAVPAQYQGWVNTAARGTGLPAAVVAAQINEESGFNPRAVSSAGAQGIAQFIPSTWASNAPAGSSPFDPNASLAAYTKLMGTLLRQYGGNVRNALAAYNAGPGNLRAGLGYANTILSNAGAGTNVTPTAATSRALPSVPAQRSSSVSLPVTTQGFNQQGFKDAMGRFIAGQFIQNQGGSSNPYNASPGATKGFSAGLNVSNPLLASGQLTTTQPTPQNFVTSQTHMQQVATGQLQQLAGGSLVNVHAGAKGYVNPIAGAVIGRTDMGVDANLHVGAPIRAIGDSKVLGIYPNWYKGQPYLELQLTSGPKAGQIYYVAEQISPTVRPGQTVRAGQTVATYAPSGTGIEIGWGAGGGRTLAQAQGNTGDSSHGNAPAGTNFRAFLGGLK